MWIVLSIVSVALAVAIGWALPAWAAPRIVRAMEAAGHVVPNFRGRPVALGLGLVWLVWAAGVAVGSSLITLAVLKYDTFGLLGGLVGLGWPDWSAALPFTPFATVVAISSMPSLVMGSVAFGLADDLLGSSDDRGFAGHWRALRHGRLSSGMLKMLGIGALAFVASAGIAETIASRDTTVAAAAGWERGACVLLAWLASTLVISLSANLVNLTDVRPGRALKTYTLLAVTGAGLSLWSMWRAMDPLIAASSVAADRSVAEAASAGLPVGDQGWVWLAALAVCLLVFVLGPVFAVWRYDLGERAMLGDAGANAMGALAGLLLARSAPLWLLVALAVVLVALNLASERVSFSSVIERVRVLRWFDDLGRLGVGPEARGVTVVSGANGGTRAGGPAAEDDDARRDDVS
jgi:hypothetical protein